MPPNDGKLSHRDAQPLLVHPVELAVSCVEEVNLSSQRSRLVLAHGGRPCWAGPAAMVNLSSNSLFGLRFCRSGMIMVVGGKQLCLPQIAARRGCPSSVRMIVALGAIAVSATPASWPLAAAS